MAKKAKSTKVESIRHQDKRKNIPTEELRDFVVEDEQAPQKMLYLRDPSLDPQLVWKGKDEQDREDLAVPVVPIYIQEKIHPQAIIDDVARASQPVTNAVFGSSSMPPAIEVREGLHGQDGHATADIRKGFVYKRVPHVTLKSIANNPDIQEGMTREAIDAAIARHAETETLYDQPYEDKKRVRVSGPFTVESLSPHRTISVEEKRDRSEHWKDGRNLRMIGPDDFGHMIIENLKRQASRTR
jgi:hypothetical protein